MHSKGSYIYLQIMGLGRLASPDWLESKGHPFIAASPNVDPTWPAPRAPREMTIDEIHEFITQYKVAAFNAVERVGFDGVEVHGGNGGLAHQFLHETVNQRTDAYGGSIEKRSRFFLEAVKVVTDAIGVKKTGVRFSPWFDGTLTMPVNFAIGNDLTLM